MFDEKSFLHYSINSFFRFRQISVHFFSKKLILAIFERHIQPTQHKKERKSLHDSSVYIYYICIDN